MARARWQRERDKAAARYEECRRARERGEPHRGGSAAPPPDEHHRVRKAWAAYQAEAAAAGRDTGTCHSGDTADTADTDGTDGTGAGQPAATGDTGDTEQRFTANLTDPDSRLVKTRNGWIQGYNCQTATSEDGFIVSARATQDANDVEQFIPTMNDVTATAQTLADRTGRAELQHVGTMIGDAGYDSAANLAAEGPDRLIADGKRRTIETRAAADPATGDPPVDATTRDKMNHRLRTPEGLALCRRRGNMVEAPIAWLKDRRGLRRFSRRGRQQRAGRRRVRHHPFQPVLRRLRLHPQHPVSRVEIIGAQRTQLLAAQRGVVGDREHQTVADRLLSGDSQDGFPLRIDRYPRQLGQPGDQPALVTARTAAWCVTAPANRGGVPDTFLDQEVVEQPDRDKSLLQGGVR